MAIREEAYSAFVYAASVYTAAHEVSDSLALYRQNNHEELGVEFESLLDDLTEFISKAESIMDAIDPDMYEIEPQMFAAHHHLCMALQYGESIICDVMEYKFNQ